MNVIKYREDENTFLSVLKDLLLAKPEMRMKFATGYLNLQKEFLDQVVKADTPGKV